MLLLSKHGTKTSLLNSGPFSIFPIIYQQTVKQIAQTVNTDVYRMELKPIAKESEKDRLFSRIKSKKRP
jgi:hypothetical protein